MKPRSTSLLLKKAKWTQSGFQMYLVGTMNSAALAIAKSLVNRGMVIEITKTEFESLHPRFAITNRYRRRCGEDGIPFKKNLKIDNIGIVLEKQYEDARTK